MDDFLYILRLRLEGRIPDEEVLPQVRLYENYINSCVAGGDPLERVLRRLGDPSDVADKIVEAYEKRLQEIKDEPMVIMRTLLKEFTGDDDEAVDARMEVMKQAAEEADDASGSSTADETDGVSGSSTADEAADMSGCTTDAAGADADAAEADTAASSQNISPSKDAYADADAINARIQNPKRGIKAEFSQEKGWNVHIGGFKLNSWYGYLIIVLIVVVIFGLLGQLN